MTKEIFLQDLCLALKRKLPKSEIAEIVADYDGFFAAGASEGKAESQICAELGDVSAIADELRAELGAGRNHKKKGFYRFSASRFRVSGLLILLFAGYCIFLLPESINIRLALVGVVLLNMALGVIFFAKMPASAEVEAGSRRLVMAAHGLLLSIVVGTSVIVYWQFKAPQAVGLLRNPETAGPRLWLIMVACALLALAVALLTLSRLPRSPFKSLSVIFSATATLMFLGSLIWLLHRLNDFARFQANLWILLGVYSAVMGLSMFYNVLLRRIRGRR